MTVSKRSFRRIDSLAHYRRLSGTARWMINSQRLASSEGLMPVGFTVLTSDLDHKQSRYSFAGPLGIFTFKREPHDDEQGEGKWFQATLDGLDETLDESVDAFAGVKAYVNVPPEGVPTVVFTHLSFDTPVTVALDEFESEAPLPFSGGSQSRRTKVQSDRVTEEEVEGTPKGDR